jgi:phosphatidylglycerol---prolipoprotein diacylglyceryl transferase
MFRSPGAIAVQVGPLTLRWYGILMATAMALGLWLAHRDALRRGVDPEPLLRASELALLGGLVGARLYYVLFNLDYYARVPAKILAVWEGGLAIHGGVIGGILLGGGYAWSRGLPLRTYLDIAAPSLAIGQAIGRWGNFFNQELYGPPTTLPWGIAIDCVHRVAAYPCSEFPLATTHFHPLFLYESISGLIGAITLLWLARHAKRLVAGDLLGIFFIWYGTTRFLLEFFRSGNWTFFGIPVAQIVTLGFIVFGVALIWYRHGPGRPAETGPDEATDAEVTDGEATEPGTGPAHTPDAPPA